MLRYLKYSCTDLLGTQMNGVITVLVKACMTRVKFLDNEANKLGQQDPSLLFCKAGVIDEPQFPSRDRMWYVHSTR